MSARWHARARSLRERGHTMLFIAGQVGEDPGEVAAYIIRWETAKEAVPYVPMQTAPRTARPYRTIHRD